METRMILFLSFCMVAVKLIEVKVVGKELVLNETTTNDTQPTTGGGDAMQPQPSPLSNVSSQPQPSSLQPSTDNTPDSTPSIQPSQNVQPLPAVEPSPTTIPTPTPTPTPILTPTPISTPTPIPITPTPQTTPTVVVPIPQPQPESEPQQSQPQSQPTSTSTSTPTPTPTPQPSPTDISLLVENIRDISVQAINLYLRNYSCYVNITGKSEPDYNPLDKSVTAVIYNCTNPQNQQSLFEETLQRFLNDKSDLQSNLFDLTVKSKQSDDKMSSNAWLAIVTVYEREKVPATVLYIIIGVITAVALIITVVLIVSLNRESTQISYRPIEPID